MHSSQVKTDKRKNKHSYSEEDFEFRKVDPKRIKKNKKNYSKEREAKYCDYQDN